MNPLEAFLTNLVKKALMSAASTAGSKIGGVAAQYALDLLGLDSPNDLADIKLELDTISAQVNKIDSKVSQLIDDTKWSKVTLNFADICSDITTHNDNLQALLAIKDDTQRDAKITSYIKTANPHLDELDAKLAEIDNRIRGLGDGITGTSDDPLMKVYLETHWGTTWDKDPAQTHKNILAVYIHAAQVQRLATTLLVAYREATGFPSLAVKARERLEARLKAQYVVMLQFGPDFVMLNDLPTPGLQVDFSGFDIAPTHVSFEKGWLTPSPTQGSFQWALKRIGVDSNMAKYRLSLNGDLLASELETQVIVDRFPPVWGKKEINFRYVDVSFVQLLRNVTSPLVFSIEVTDQRSVLRMKLADGRTLGYLDRGYSGHTFELTATEATPSNGLVTCSNFNKKPIAGRPTLSAWSRAFAAIPAGEGRFKPGYRVRYRVVHVNRFGESDKSDWLLAPKVNEDHQDSQGYFGNDTFYFPQIALSVDPTGRTEGYRIFRQFQGEVEEEVTGGSYMGDPLSGKPVIFDDFMA